MVLNFGVRNKLEGQELGLSSQERWSCAVIVGFNAFLALGAAVLKLVSGMDLSILMKDVVVIANLPPYAGAYQMV